MIANQLQLFNTDTTKIKISGQWLKHLFNCTHENIINNCHGHCCEGSNKIVISLLPDEEKEHTLQEYIVKNGLLQPDPITKKCPHKAKSGLCTVHNTSLKPFGCTASPFTLNKSNTPIIRYRYSRMKCHGIGLPAYITFKRSLDLILGIENTQTVSNHLSNSNNDIFINISTNIFSKLKYLDSLKQ
jgi:hypothetical protein